MSNKITNPGLSILCEYWGETITEIAQSIGYSRQLIHRHATGRKYLPNVEKALAERFNKKIHELRIYLMQSPQHKPKRRQV